MPDAISDTADVSPPPRPPLVVLGMHRSGTSVLTGALALCGAWVGTEAELTDPNPENPKGFWERRDLRAICNALLAGAGADWWRVADFDPARVPQEIRAAQAAAWAEVVAGLEAREPLAPEAGRAPWAVKEPRLCFVLPLLRPVMPDPVCVLVHRAPLEVARSLAARNGFGILEGLALWEAYTRSALAVSADLPRVQLGYADLLADPAGTMTRLVARLEVLGVAGLHAPEPVALAEFVTPTLHRHRAEEDEAAALLTPEQAQLWAAVSEAAAGAETGDGPETGALSPAAALLLRDLDARQDLARALRAETGRLGRSLTTRRAERAGARRVEAKLTRTETDLAAARVRIEELAANRAKAKGALKAEREHTAAQAAETEAAHVAELAERQARIEALEAETGALHRETAQLARRRKEAETRLTAVQKEIKKLLRSTSWRLTAPLRVSGQALKDARRGTLWRRPGKTAAPRLLPQPTAASGGQRDRLRRWLERSRHERLIAASPLFDPGWFLAEYPEAAQADHDPARHFLAHARREGLNPSAAFDTIAYMKAHPDVARSGMNPLVHYLMHGRTEGRRIAPVSPRRTDTDFDPAAARAWVAALRADPAHARLRAALEAGDDGRAEDGNEDEDGAQAEVPLVSVILPTRDRAALLPQAIESVRAQSYPRWELVVVDDGSTDGTAAMLAADFPDPRIRVVTTPGLGVSGARNAGLEAARGALIAYLDSDNFWMPDYLELMTAEFARSGASCVYAVLKVREEAKGRPASIWHRARPFDFEALAFSNYIDLNIFMHRADLVARHGGFDPDLRRAVDWDLILRYLRRETVSFANFVGAEYDHSDRADRLTVRELFAYKNVVRNKHWIDWEALEAELEARDPRLVSVVMCLQGSVEATETRLQALFTHPAGRRFELVLVDNGVDAVSKAILSEWARRESRIRLVESRENVHLALGSNLGFAATRGSVVVFLDDRVEVSPEWLRTLTRPLDDPAVMGAQPKVLTAAGAIAGVGLVFGPRGPLPYPLHAGRPGDFAPTDRPRALASLMGACAAFRAADIVAVRGFHPIYSTEAQDADLCLRLGGGAAVFRSVPDALVRLHPGGPRIRPARIEADRRQFALLWGARITPDDAAHYAHDGLEAPAAYVPDRPEWAEAGTALWQPEPPAAPLPPAGLEGRTIALKIGCPKPEMKDHWGDYHFAVALAGAFLRKGVAARIDFAADPDRHARADDLNLVLRGRQRFEPKPGTLNLMWLISHPDRASVEEMLGFDHVFVASRVWAERVAATPGLSCEALLQCTDSARFSPAPPDPARASRALFVANSRNVLRSVVREAMEQDLTLDIYGEMWEGLAPAEWIRAKKIENVDLPRHYASAEVVLNDHWDSMRENGFVSNRIFDVLACAAPLVTDRITGLPEEIAAGCRFFGEGVALSEAVAAARAARDPERERALAETVRRDHSFNARAGVILAVIAARLAAPAAEEGAASRRMAS